MAGKSVDDGIDGFAFDRGPKPFGHFGRRLERTVRE